MEHTLKPCPWCGDDAEVIDMAVAGEPQSGFQVACIRAREDTQDYCAVAPFTCVHRKRNEALAAWNTRVDPERQKLVEALTAAEKAEADLIGQWADFWDVAPRVLIDSLMNAQKLRNAALKDASAQEK
jgi:uncharacterized protein (DUF1697 family)